MTPTTEQVRAAIATQVCPWCDRGPFKSLVMHTAKGHGIEARELRDLAGLMKKDPLCSTELSEFFRQRNLESGYKPPGWSGGHGMDYTEAGRTHLLNVLKSNSERIAADPEIRARSAASHRKDECMYGHSMSGDNLRVNPGGSRECRACCRRRDAERTERRRAAKAGT